MPSRRDEGKPNQNAYVESFHGRFRDRDRGVAPRVQRTTTKESTEWATPRYARQLVAKRITVTLDSRPICY